MKPRRVVVLAFAGAELLDLAGPINVLTAATRLAPGRRGYAIEVAAVRAGALETAGGVAVVARDVSAVRGAIDTLIVPGGLDADTAGSETVPHIRRLAVRSGRVVGVCSGAFLLAEAGLLARRRAVTHWAGCARLRARYADVRVEDDAIFVRDGRVWTSAGVTAGMDLALALVEQDLGGPLALEVARWLVMYLRRPGGQSQFSAPLAAQRAAEAPIRALIGWARANLREDLSVPALARRASMSERHFARVFAAQAGCAPAAWVRRARLEAARAALEMSDRSVKEIADACGFGSAEVLHHAFQRSLGTTPMAYRARFTTQR